MNVNLKIKNQSFRFMIISLFLLPIMILGNKNNDGSIISGELKVDTVLDTTSGPWTVVGTITIPENITLTIEPGVTVYFKSGKKIIVEKDGCLCAVGNAENKILMTRKKGTNSHWGGIYFNSTMKDNQLCYVKMYYADYDKQSIFLDHSKLLIDNMKWNNHNKKILDVNHPSLIVQNSIFPDLSHTECIRGFRLKNNDYLIIRNNVFGRVGGKHDAIDFSIAHRPGPILQVYNNIFLGGNDEALDLDGCDAHIEGNYFTGFYPYANYYTSNAISTGKYYENSEITVVRNVFYDNDHAILLKQGAYLIAENNTFVNSSDAAINFSEMPNKDFAPGKGAYLEGNIFWNNNRPFKNLKAHSYYKNPKVKLHFSLISSKYHYLGNNNIDMNPKFYDNENDFHLLPTSPAIGAGPNGIDMGAYVKSGVSIFGEPDSITSQTSASISINGPGITHYTYAVNSLEAEWTEEIYLADNPIIELSDLMDKLSYTIYVKGKNSAGVWQTEPQYAISKTWTVDLDTISETNGTISGLIFETDTLTPISETEIIFHLSSDNIADSLITTTTNDTGYYYISVDPGLYYVKATGKVPTGFLYESQYYSNAIDTSEATMVYVEPGQIINDINFILLRKGLIMGTVFLENIQTPIDSATIEIFDEDWLLVQLSDSIIGDTMGSYSIHLPTNNYYLHAFVTIGEEFFEDYYLNATTQENATFIALISPDTVRNVDFILKAQNQNSINFKNQNCTTKSFFLLQNFPNPFNNQTRILYTVPENNKTYRIRITIHDTLGRLVKVIKEGDESAGRHSINWNGINHLGQSLPSGIYFYRLSSENFSKTKKMILMQ